MLSVSVAAALWCARTIALRCATTAGVCLERTWVVSPAARATEDGLTYAAGKVIVRPTTARTRRNRGRPDMRLPFNIMEGLCNEIAQATRSPWTLRLD